MDMAPKGFEERIQFFQQHKIEQQKSVSRLSWARLTAFLTFATVSGILFYHNIHQIAIITSILGLFIFGILINLYNKAVFKRNHFNHLIHINQEAINRQNLKLDGLDQANEFVNEEHTYNSDLDIFGKHSIWQLVWHGNTNPGKRTLSTWLNEMASPKEIKERQAATLEIKNQIDWSQNFEAQGKHEEEHGHSNKSFINWVKSFNNKTPIYLKVLSYFMLAVNLSSIYAFIYLDQSFFLVLLSLALSFALMGTSIKKLGSYMGVINKGDKLLSKYARLLKAIEEAPLTTSYSKKQIDRLQNGTITASKAIAQFSKIITAIDARGNMIYMVLNGLFLMDIHLLLRLEKWQQENHQYIESWFEAIGNMEAINSLGAFAYNFPEMIIPNLIENTSSESAYHVSATSLGHPLIHHQTRVSNDFCMTKKGTIYLITGSNMSGKSTFLRTLGVNLVLAGAGGPVQAKTFSFAPIQLFTSMRTRDKLEESVSSFYAELQRIKQLLSLTEKEKPTLFMLDEILKGTNSADRHKGAAGLIHQLMKTNAMGFISTHDLKLGQIADESDRLKNYSFNSTIQGNKISFDYTLTPGVCSTFNASVLMKNIGIILDQENDDIKI